MRPRRAFLAFALAAAAAWSYAQQAPGQASLRSSGEIDWKAPGSLPPGAEYHLIHEDPATHGVSALVRFPRKYALPEHWHSHDETIVVLKGRISVMVDGRETVLDKGSYAFFPAGSKHSLRAASFGGCQFFMTLNGPFDTKLEQRKGP